MKHEVIERLQTLLRDEGFTNLSTHARQPRRDDQRRQG